MVYCGGGRSCPAELLTIEADVLCQINGRVQVTAEEQELRPLYCGSALGVWGGGVPEPTRVCILCQEEVSTIYNLDRVVRF